VPVGRELADLLPPERPDVPDGGSIIVVAATDAPLLPHQCRRLAQRASLGIARGGGGGEHSSGDMVIAFATDNRLPPEEVEDVPPVRDVAMLNDHHIDPLFWAAIEATEEAVVNSLVAAQTMTGRDGITFHALPHERLREVMARYGRGAAAGG
jgi:D-aminopeptidase